MNQSDPDEWHRTWTHVVGRQVRKTRTQREMSAQALSDRCSALGFPVPRNTVANLENGRKATITLGELVAIAAALEVHPVQLLYPLEGVEEVEVLPGRFEPPLTALHWFSAELGLSWPDGVAAPGLTVDDQILRIGRRYFDVHREFVLTSKRLEAMNRASSSTSEDLDFMNERMRLIRDRLRVEVEELTEYGTGVPLAATWKEEQDERRARKEDPDDE